MVRPGLNVLPPTTLEEIFANLAPLTDEQFNVLKSAVESGEGFDTEKERCERLGQQMEVAPEVVGYIMGALSFLYQRISKESFANTDVASIVSNFVEGFEEETLANVDKPKLISRISTLVSPKRSIDEARKLSRLRAGFLPNMRSIATLVDLRPNYDSEHSQITGLVPVVQVRISTDADDPERKYFVFQADERKLKAMKQVIEEAEKKLDVLSSSHLLSNLIQVRGDRDGD